MTADIVFFFFFNVINMSVSYSNIFPYRILTILIIFHAVLLCIHTVLLDYVSICTEVEKSEASLTNKRCIFFQCSNFFSLFRQTSCLRNFWILAFKQCEIANCSSKLQNCCSSRFLKELCNVKFLLYCKR